VIKIVNWLTSAGNWIENIGRKSLRKARVSGLKRKKVPVSFNKSHFVLEAPGQYSITYTRYHKKGEHIFTKYFRWDGVYKKDFIIDIEKNVNCTLRPTEIPSTPDQEQRMPSGGIELSESDGAVTRNYLK